MDKVRRSANKETKGAPPNFFTVMSAKHASSNTVQNSFYSTRQRI